jgi:hypothetical protein
MFYESCKRFIQLLVLIFLVGDLFFNRGSPMQEVILIMQHRLNFELQCPMKNPTTHPLPPQSLTSASAFNQLVSADNRSATQGPW